MRHDRISLAIALLAGLCGTACKTAEKKASAATPQDSSAMISRGKYLVTVAACGDCHTPMKLDPKLGMPVPDMTRMLSGQPEGAPGPEAKPGSHDQAVIGPTFTSFRLPFGTVYSANLTPDPETGIGRWSEATFVRTIRNGHHLGAQNARPILPPMPWMAVAQMTDPDLAAVFAYLRSIPPVKNHVPPPDVPGAVLADIAKKQDAMRSSP